MGNLHKTALKDRHVNLGANMVEFAGWEMLSGIKICGIRAERVKPHEIPFDRLRENGSQDNLILPQRHKEHKEKLLKALFYKPL